MPPTTTTTTRPRGRSSPTSRGGPAPSQLSQMGLPAQLYLWVRHAHWMIGFWTARLLGRFLSGRVMLQKRATDATWLRPARAVRGKFWASRAGWVRQAVRLAPLAFLIGWLSHPGATVLLFSLLLALGVWGLWRKWRKAQHDRFWLEPIWPAVVHILGAQFVGDAPPSSWVEMPPDPSDEDAVIVVGLPEESDDDLPKIRKLRTLFTQRLEVGKWIEDSEHADRIVTFRHRPPDPDIWEPLAKILDLDPDEHLSGEWLDMSPDLNEPAAEVRVNLPNHLVDVDRRLAALQDLANQRFPGQWVNHTHHQDLVVVLRHKEPEPEPPTFVDVNDMPEFADLLAETTTPPPFEDLVAAARGVEDAEVVDAEFDDELLTVPDDATEYAEVVEDLSAGPRTNGEAQ